ncbi:MAG: ParB/RepB/Spo0J family partition protein [Clostridia bacterium]
MSKGLGRGLDAFFGNEELQDMNNPSNKILESVVDLNINEIEPMLNQPRKIFDKDKLNELADSIKENGVLQPIIVVKDINGYTIVAGERRWRAAKIAKLKSVPAIVKDYTDTKKKQVALIENIQREDLNIVEIAKAISELIEIEGYTNTEVAKITGKNSSTISNILRLLKLDEKILLALMMGDIVEGHARCLLAIDEDKRLDILDKIIAKKLTVRDTEKLIYGSEEYERKKEKKKPKNIYITGIEDKLKNYFGYKVKIDATKSHQKLIIEYTDNDGLDHILNKLKIKL